MVKKPTSSGYRFEKGDRFWEVRSENGALVVSFGRRGAEGTRRQVGRYDGAALDRARGKLVRAKEREGYRWVATLDGGVVRSPRPERAVVREKPVREKPSAAAIRAGSIAPVLAALERFVRALEQGGGELQIRVRPRKPSTVAAIRAYEKASGHRVPRDLAAFWTSRVPNFSVDGPDGELFVATYFDGPGSRSFAAQCERFASEGGSESERDRLMASGIPFWNDESTLLWDAVRGGVRQTAGEPSSVPTQAIAPTFTAFLQQFVGAGCFSCGTGSRATFARYWREAQRAVPVRVPPSRNRWLAHLGRFYVETPRRRR